MSVATSIGVVAHYNLLERLEPAGPGEVYRARDTRHGRTVIVRVLPAMGQADEQVLLRQLESLSKLSHQNVIHLYQAGVHEGRVYLAFEHLTGRSLRAEMAGRQMNVRRAVEAAIGIADAVAEAHALGFLHRGISPDSIGFTTKGHVKVAASHLGTILGFQDHDSSLMDYESPEEGRGELADERADVYSIGAVLYEMLTARRPMPRGASAPSGSHAMVPAAVDAVVLKAVAPNPERRFQTAAEFGGALRAVLPGLQLPDVPRELTGAGSTSAGRIGVMTVVLLAALAAIAWWLMRS